MVNQAVIAVGFGIVTGLIVIFAFLLVRYFKRRYPSNKETQEPLCCATFSDPRVRSRTIIRQDVPVFHLPTMLPFSIQEPVCKGRTDSRSSDLCCNGYQLVSQQVPNEEFVRSRQGTSLSLEDINTVGHSPLPIRKKVSSGSSQSDRSQTPTKSPIAEQKNRRKMGTSGRKLSVNLGRLEFSIYYDQGSRLLQIYVNRGFEIKGTSVGKEALPDVLVTVSLSRLNDFQIVWEEKTKLVCQSSNPLFNQKLSDIYDIDASDMQDLILRFQVVDDHASHVVGAVTQRLEGFTPNKLHTRTKPLESVQVYMSDEEELFYRLEPPNLGELLVALCYNPTDHKLLVKIQEARKLVHPRKSGNADPYLKLELLFCGKKLFSKSSKVVHNTLKPVFDETFVFDVNSEKLPQVALVIKVKHHGIVRDTGMSVLHFGYCVEVESQYKHWEQVLGKPHLEIEQWHRLHAYETAVGNG